MNPDLTAEDLRKLQKPMKGTALLERRGKSRSRVTAEQTVMREAVRLDGHKCRYPSCQYRDLPIDPAHMRGSHRSMGGNPKLDRTTLETVLALCRIHHGQYDRGDFDITPIQADRGARGLLTFTRVIDGVKMLMGIS